jgi:hypothetical protein
MTEETKEIQLNLEEMRKMKIFVATPMYGGQCYGLYTKSLMDTTSMFMHYGIEMQIYYLFNESLVTRARNYCVANFLKSESTHMLFIDSDVAWQAKDLMYMTHLVAEDPEKYRFDDNPVALEKVAGDMVFNPDHKAYPNGRAPIYEPVKVKEAGTGFMMIHRSVFEEYAEAHPELEYTPDHLREGEFKLGEKIHAYFDCIINEENRYLSEDYMFCENLRKQNIDIWTLPMVELMHCGSYIYQGKLVDMALNDVHATMSPEDIGKIRSSRPYEDDKNSS